MYLSDVLDDGQAEPRSPELAAAALVHHVESLEYPVLMYLWYPAAVILNRNSAFLTKS